MSFDADGWSAIAGLGAMVAAFFSYKIAKNTFYYQGKRDVIDYLMKNAEQCNKEITQEHAFPNSDGARARIITLMHNAMSKIINIQRKKEEFLRKTFTQRLICSEEYLWVDIDEIKEIYFGELHSSIWSELKDGKIIDGSNNSTLILQRDEVRSFFPTK